MSTIQCCCSPPNHNFTLHATKCSTLVYPGVAVSVTAGGTSVAGGTTDAAGGFVTTLAAGSYTVTLTDPNGIVLAFTLTMAAADQTVTKNFVTSLSASVTNACGGGGLSGAALTFQQGGVTIGTATTNGAGVGTCTLTTNIPLTTVTVSAVYKGTTQTCTGTPTASCPNLCTISYMDTFTVSVTGCNGLPLPGASVTITPDGSTGTTDASGNVTITPSTGVANGTVVSATVSATRFTAATLNFPYPTPCTATVGLSAASGYVCVPGCVYPLATVLNGTDPLGSFTMTYDPAQSQWVGCVLRNSSKVNHIAAGPSCVASTATQAPVQFSWTGSDFGIAWPTCTNGFGVIAPTDDACSTNVGTPWVSYSNVALIGSGANKVSLSSTCPPSATMTGVYNFTSTAAISKIYGTGHSTFSWTE